MHNLILSLCVALNGLIVTVTCTDTGVVTVTVISAVTVTVITTVTATVTVSVTVTVISTVTVTVQVVLPMLDSTVVGPGWLSQADFLTL